MTATRTTTARTSAHSKSITLDSRDAARQLAQQLGKNLLAFMVGKHAKTISRWTSEEAVKLSEADADRIRDIYQIFALLLEVEGNHTIRAWFMGMNPQLNDESPAEAIAEGRVRDAMGAARAFVSGG